MKEPLYIGARRRAVATAALVVAIAATAIGAAAARAETWADPSKTLRVMFLVAETGFDPQVSNDLYSNYVNREIFEAPLAYDYLARPYKLVANTCSLPQISGDGLTWTIKVKPGIYFTDDPVFKGRKRELTAADYVYSWKRVIDPKLRSPNLQTFDGLFAGADALVAKAKATGKFDYDAPMEGLQAIDRYTLRIKLVHPSYPLMHDLTTSIAGAVAREVIEAHGDASGWAMANPVGTGPYRLGEWRRGQKIVLLANTGYREVRFPESGAPEDRTVLSRMHGKRLPQIGRVEISIIEESNPRLLAFERGDLDYIAIPADLIAKVLTRDNTLQPRFQKAGVVLGRGVQPSIAYTYFNMENPVVGGYTRDKVALRRAIGMAYNSDEEIRVVRQAQAMFATQPIPPNVGGYDPDYDGHTGYDPQGAKALLDKFGFVDRDGDGFRDLPDGKPLTLQLAFTPSANERPYHELWQRSMKAVGIRTDFVIQKWPDLLKMSRSGQLMMWSVANTSTTTDGYQFLGLLYGGHAGLSNLSRFKLPEYDRLYEASRALPEGPARTRMFQQMSALVTAYSPWILNAYRIENNVIYPWVAGYKYNALNPHPWQFYDIDNTRAHTPVAR